MSRPTTELAHLFRQLKAPAAARALPKLADRARAEQFAAALLKTETDSRDSHGGQARIKTARFPARKTLEEFDFAFQTSLKRDGLRLRDARRDPPRGVTFQTALGGQLSRGLDTETTRNSPTPDKLIAARGARIRSGPVSPEVWRSMTNRAAQPVAR